MVTQKQEILQQYSENTPRGVKQAVDNFLKNNPDYSIIVPITEFEPAMLYKKGHIFPESMIKDPCSVYIVPEQIPLMFMAADDSPLLKYTKNIAGLTEKDSEP